MNFGITISRQKILKEVSVEDSITGLPVGIFYKSYQDGMRIRFVCHYPAAISVSDTFQITSAKAGHRLSNSGSLATGFSLTAFRDSLFSQIVSPGEKVFIGNSLYVQVTWAVKSEDLQFYLSNCYVSSSRSDIKVQVVQDNCYASTLGAHLIGSSHYSVNSNARFRYVN